MTTTDLLTKINGSVLSDGTKQKISAALTGHDEVTSDLQSVVNNLIQSEIDADFETLGLTDAIPEVAAINEKFAADVDGVEKELDADLAYVEKELNELEGMQKDITKAEEQVQIEDLKTQLGA